MTIRRATLPLALLFACVAYGAQAQQVFDENEALPTTPGANPEIEKQVQGDFSPMQRQVPPPLGALQHIWDNAGPQAGVTRFQYTPGNSFKITTREGMTTTLRLPEWEQIETIILGDQHIYRYQQLDDSTVEIWTTIPGSDTSLKILGASRNIYTFYVRSETFNSVNEPDLTVYVDASAPVISSPTGAGTSSLDTGGNTAPAVGPQSSFVTNGGGTPSQLTTADNPSPEWIKAIGFDPARIRRDMALFGDAELAPDDIFRDDQFTYMCFGEQWDDSSLMVAAPYQVVDGVDRQVNFRVAHNCMIIETTGPLTLRRGEKVLCVRDDPDKVKPRLSGAAARVQPLLPKQPQASTQTQTTAPAAAQPAPAAAPVQTQPLPQTATPTAPSSNEAPDLRPKRTEK